MIDWGRVATLRDEVGAEDFDEVVELFLEEVDTAIGGLKNAAPPSDLGEKLHFLKGSAMSLGFTEFSSLCQNGETISSKDPSAVIDIDGIMASYRKSRRVFLDGLGEQLPN